MKTILLPLIALSLLTACASEEPIPSTVNMSQMYYLVDDQDRQAGMVIMRPLGEGEVRDNNGTLIGVISAPQQIK